MMWQYVQRRPHKLDFAAVTALHDLADVFHDQVRDVNAINVPMQGQTHTHTTCYCVSGDQAGGGRGAVLCAEGHVKHDVHETSLSGTA